MNDKEQDLTPLDKAHESARKHPAYTIYDSPGVTLGRGANSITPNGIGIKIDPGPTLRSCLDIAADLVDGDRNKLYGDPADNHGCTAAMFGAYLRRRYAHFDLVSDLGVFDAQDVCVFNMLQKISRLANAYHEDCPVDIAGYARNLQLVHEAAENPDD